VLSAVLFHNHVWQASETAAIGDLHDLSSVLPVSAALPDVTDQLLLAVHGARHQGAQR
jgi:hypothetical protein